MLDLEEFYSDLRSVLGPRVLKRVGRKVLGDDCLGLAGQLAYFTLFSMFPFLLSLAALVGLVIDDPASLLRILAERMQSFLPKDAVRLLEDYINLTLRGAAPSVLLFGVLATFWSGWRRQTPSSKRSIGPMSCKRPDRGGCCGVSLS